MGVNPALRGALLRLFATHSNTVRAVVLILAESVGCRMSASEVARRAGLPDRDALYRILRSEGLPALTSLARLVRVLNWSLEADRIGASLASLARDDSRYASQYARDVKKALGVTWTEAHQLGPEWVAGEIRQKIS